jgi:hypothetical protein
MAAFFDAGKYRILTTRQALVENKKGNPEFQLSFKPIEYHPTKGEPDEINVGYERTQFMTMTDATMGTPEKPGWVLQTLTALGFNGSSFGQLDPEHKNHISFVDRDDLFAICTHEDYDGKTREKWNILRPNGAEGGKPIGKPIEKKSVRTLDSKFKKVLSAFAKSQPSQAQEPAPDTTEPAPMDPETGLVTAGAPAEEPLPF